MGDAHRYTWRPDEHEHRCIHVRWWARVFVWTEKTKKKKTKMKERRKYGGIKRAVHLPKLVRVAVIRTSRAYCALNRSVPFAPISNIYIYMYEFDKRQFQRVVLENTGSFRRIKLLSTRIDHVSLHREECILHLVFDLKYISSFVGIAFTLTWVGNYTDSERTVIAYPFER